MKVIVAALMSGSILTGCAAVAPSQVAGVSSRTDPPQVEATPPTHTTNLLRVSLTSDPEKPSRVRCEIHLEGPVASLRSFHFQPSHDAHLDAVSAESGGAAVESHVDVRGAVTAVAIAPHKDGALDLRYAVILASSADPLAPFAEPTELRAEGEDLLLLPDLAEPVAIEIQLQTGSGNARAASSFGLGNDVRATLHLADLRQGFFMAGDVGSAAFHTTDGDDFAGWIGYTSFDPRWVSAETASVRSAVDDYMDRAPGTGAPAISLLFTAQKRHDPPLAIVRRAHGLLVSTDPGAAWSAPSRIHVAQALVQRYIGGLVWVGDRNDEASGYFFSEGFSRAVADRLLSDLGTLDHVDRATEVSSLLNAIDLSPLGHASLADLAHAHTDEAVRVLTARGALVALSLDATLRKNPDGKHSLKKFLRGVLEAAAKNKSDTLSFADFMALVRGAVDAAPASELEKSLRDGVEIALPSDLVGPCYRLARKQIAPFELGFVVRGTSTLTIESVVAGSHAASAGLKVGDVVTDVRYQDGRSDVPVSVVVVRNGKPEKLHFLPAGTPKPGRVFERVRGVADEHC